jgi:3-methyl-2-oxobutanoate hydroxymethyltransferase
MAHIGMLPQSVREEGGYKMKGRTAPEAERLVRDALPWKRRAHLPSCSRLSRRTSPSSYRSGKDSNDRNWLGRTLRRTNPGDSRLDRSLPMVHAKFVSPQAQVAEEIRKAARIFVDRTRGGG